MNEQLSAGQTWHATTIVSVRKDGKVVVAGDGQVSLGQTVIKHSAKKVRPLAKGRVISGFAGATADLGGYAAVVISTFFAPEEIIGVAYDAGGVTTSTITVPLVTAIGVGLASSIRGRNPMTDGFGLIAFASLTPMSFVMLYGIFV